MASFNERQIRFVHELMYQLKIKEAMTTSVITFPPTARFREIQLCMKKKRFSGTPIVENDELVGIVSIDDIITAFDQDYIDEPVHSHMTRSLHTIPQNYSVIAASNMFSKYRYGRLPVVEKPNSKKLVGILTFGDILSYLLLQMNSIAERIEEQEQSMHKKMESARDNLHFDLAPDNFDMAGAASTSTKKHLIKMGVPPPVIRRVAVICYEAEMNVIIHSLGGCLDVNIMEGQIRIQVCDDGPGIPDLEKAMSPGYTTANEKIRALGFGAGMGLVNIKRCADHFKIDSSMEKGTEVEAIVYINPSEPENAGEKSS